MFLLHHLPDEVGMPLLGLVRGQGHFGEQVRSREKCLRACGQVRGQLCLLKQHGADLFPVASRGAQQEADMLPQECRSGQAVPASTVCATHTPEGTQVLFPRSSEETVPVSPEPD